jgi:hypothetical protein
MRPLFIMSLICVAMSLLALFGLSAMTVVSRPGAESIRTQMMMVAGVFTVAWLGVAFWARPRQAAAAQSLPPQWLRRSLVVAGVVYLVGVFFLVIG